MPCARCGLWVTTEEIHWQSLPANFNPPQSVRHVSNYKLSAMELQGTGYNPDRIAWFFCKACRLDRFLYTNIDARSKRIYYVYASPENGTHVGYRSDHPEMKSMSNTIVMRTDIVIHYRNESRTDIEVRLRPGTKEHRDAQICFFNNTSLVDPSNVAVDSP